MVDGLTGGGANVRSGVAAINTASGRAWPTSRPRASASLTSVASLDNTTQQNAAMAGQSAAAAASLDDQARRRSETVAVFHV